MESGVARKPIADIAAYARQLSARLDPTAGSLQGIFEAVRSKPKRVVFAEGEEEKVDPRRDRLPRRRATARRS